MKRLGTRTTLALLLALLGAVVVGAVVLEGALEGDAPEQRRVSPRAREVEREVPAPRLTPAERRRVREEEKKTASEEPPPGDPGIAIRAEIEAITRRYVVAQGRYERGRADDGEVRRELRASTTRALYRELRRNPPRAVGIEPPAQRVEEIEADVPAPGVKQALASVAIRLDGEIVRYVLELRREGGRWRVDGPARDGEPATGQDGSSTHGAERSG